MYKLTTVSSLDKVFSDRGPKLIERGGSMLGNERYNFQLSIYSDYERLAPRSTVTVEGIDPAAVSVREVVEIPAGVASYPDADDYVINPGIGSGLYPDLLRPLENGNLMIRPKSHVTLWITVHSPEGLTPGKYDVKITVKNEWANEEFSTVYALEVLPARLGETDLIYTNWFHYDSIVDYYRVEPFGEEFYKIFGSFLDSAVTHGMNMLYVPLFTPPLDTEIGGERTTVQLVGIERRNGKYSFDFKKLSKFIDFAAARNVKYYEMTHLTTQWGAKACPKIMATTENGYERIFGWDTRSLSEEYKAFLSQFLPALDEFLKSKGVAERTYFHISDEPNKEQRPYYNEVYDFIRPFIADYKVMDASSDLESKVDCPVISTTHATPIMPEKNWAYYCCSAYNEYLSNRFFNMPSERNRVLGLQLYLSGVKGFLHWGFNFYSSQYSIRKINPFLETDAGGAFPSGDSFVVYPGSDGTAWDSLRLEVFYEALGDLAALKTLEKKIGREAVVALVKGEGVSGWHDYPHDPVRLKAFRDKINRMLCGD